jgi:hypothetical protein
MAIKSDAELKQYFLTGNVPTEQQFHNFIDSKVNVGSPPVGMTIGGAVSGGTIGSFLFVGAAAALEQDNANLYYDFVNKRIGLGTVAPIARVNMKGDTNADAKPLQVIFERPAGVYNSSTNWMSLSAVGGAVTVGTFALAQQSVGQGTRWNWTVTNNATLTPATEAMRLSQSKQLSIGNQILDGAVVDVFSKGALSTDLAIRVRNSANTQDDFVVTGTGQTKIGSTGALLSPSALCQMDSTTRGVLFPRMTTVQRNAIAAPALGLFVFNTTTNQLNMWNGAAWRRYIDLP